MQLTSSKPSSNKARKAKASQLIGYALCGSTLTIPVVITNKVQAQTIDSYLTVQPIQICDNFGFNCAGMEFFEAETDKIWSQAGLDIAFLNPLRINQTDFLAIDSDDEFRSLSTTSGNGQSSNSTTINMWFVDDIAASAGSTTFGTAWVGSNGIIINDATFDFNRLDTIAHEIGHNLGLGHSSFGAGGSDNLMTTGRVRSDPNSINHITPDGEKLDRLTQKQIDQALNSVFINGIPEITVDTIGSTPYDTDDFFHVSFLDGPNGINLDWLSLDLNPVDAFFNPTNTEPGIEGSPFSTSSLNGLSPDNISVRGNFNGSQLLTLDFLNDSFGAGDSFNFGIDVDLFSQIDNFGATPLELEGALFTFGFSDGYTVTSALDQFIASSHQPFRNSQFIGTPTGGGIVPEPEEISDPIGVPEPSTSILIWLGLGTTGWLQSKLKSQKAKL